MPYNFQATKGASMRTRIALSLVSLFLLAHGYPGCSVARSGIVERAQNVVSIYGDPGDTVTYTFTDNAAVTLQAAYEAGGGTWLSNGRPPVGVLLSCETQAARISVGGATASETLGHPCSSTNFRILNQGWISTMKIAPDTAGSFPVLQISLER